MKKLALAAIVTATLGVGAGAGYLPTKLHSKETPKATCVAAAGEICPADSWMQVYEERAELLREIETLQKNGGSFKEVQLKNWQVSGMSLELSQAVPQGFGWDASRLKFIPNKPPQQALAPATAPK